MKQNDFIAVRFPNDSKQYFASVTEVKNDGLFDCRFVHTGSHYTFQQFSGWLEVKATNGNFPPGTRTNDVILYEPKQRNLDNGSHLVVTFEDGYPYLGVVDAVQPEMKIRFLHSGNVYSVDSGGVAHAAGKLYDGKRVLEKKPYSDGVSLFSTATDKIIVLEINGRSGPVRGEFEAKINADTGDSLAPNLYENGYLRAEEGKAQDKFGVNGSDQVTMTIFVAFHPSVLPYTINPRESTVIDRTTSIYGKKSFTYKKEINSLHFDIEVLYDSTTLSNTTRSEAIKTVMSEHRKGSSGTKGYEFGTEISGDIFFVEASGTVSHTRETTTTDETATGESTADATGTESSSSWTVYYPVGLDIKEKF
ncbi:hypothetical protein [Flavihumibacter petaseus]|uniref:Uncharacterized protein n=1 Tax=Flavihumibacter petaseus NBRC 106054 TaxID=1220578 RepID=A0A0E9N1C5_9BACT|nr:hypothetical protein [Flavihumibacter petaseus]GAO43553.1 hypothetical protein FPE01S_02_06580 [Flavihumibacter petaseus NBRC 106054]